jgi:hypothetical protein
MQASPAPLTLSIPHDVEVAPYKPQACVGKVVNARDLMKKIAEATWQCGFSLGFHPPLASPRCGKSATQHSPVGVQERIVEIHYTHLPLRLDSNNNKIVRLRQEVR